MICWSRRPRTLKPAETEDSTAVSWDSLKADTNQVYDLAMDLLFHPKFDEQKLQLAQQQDSDRNRQAQR